MTIWSIILGGAAGFAFGGPIGGLVGEKPPLPLPATRLNAI